MNNQTERQELLEKLALVQNLEKNIHRDIMTIAGMMNNEQIKLHIERNK